MWILVDVFFVDDVRVLRVEAAAAAARRQRGPVVVLLEDVEGFDKQVPVVVLHYSR